MGTRGVGLREGEDKGTRLRETLKAIGKQYRARENRKDRGSRRNSVQLQAYEKGEAENRQAIRRDTGSKGK